MKKKELGGVILGECHILNSLFFVNEYIKAVEDPLPLLASNNSTIPFTM